MCVQVVVVCPGLSPLVNQCLIDCSLRLQLSRCHMHHLSCWWPPISSNFWYRISLKCSLNSYWYPSHSFWGMLGKKMKSSGRWLVSDYDTSIGSPIYMNISGNVVCMKSGPMMAPSSQWIVPGFPSKWHRCSREWFLHVGLHCRQLDLGDHFEELVRDLQVFFCSLDSV